MGNGEKKKIEFVCTGNSGRSPVAELIGRNHLRKLRLNDRFDTSSSGTDVDLVGLAAVPNDFNLVSRVVRRGLQRGDIYNASQSNEAERFLQTGMMEQYNLDNGPEFDLFNIALRRFVSEEINYRAAALKELNIGGELKIGHDQTGRREKNGVEAVFAMEPRHADFANQVYSRVSGTKPLVAVLPQYALRDDKAKLINPFGGTREEYFDMVRQLQFAVPRAISRFLKEFRNLE